MSLYTLPALQRRGGEGGGDNGNQRDYASAKLSSKATKKNVHKLQLLHVKKRTKVAKSYTQMIHLRERLYFIAKQ